MFLIKIFTNILVIVLRTNFLIYVLIFDRNEHYYDRSSQSPNLLIISFSFKSFISF